jgi:oxygen-independent coproporphyrinogen-3 oxidase
MAEMSVTELASDSALRPMIAPIEQSLIERLAGPGPRYTSYPTAPTWDSEFDDRKHLERLERAGAADPSVPLSLYFHLPFCREMCRYCGCSVVVTARPERIDRYIDYLAREMALAGAKLGRRRAVEQIHLGGGTPTFLSEGQLKRLWKVIGEQFEVKAEADLALEADPRVTTKAQLELLRAQGFSRLSMGVQDFTPEVQEEIGRVQSVEQTAELFEHARGLGYQTLNFDLVYGLPRQRAETFAETLNQVVHLRPDRLALFSYAHVPWIRPHQRAIDETLLPDPVSKLRLFEQARNRLFEAGYLQIGMDHFALPDDELARARVSRRLHRNFQGYTTRPSGDTLAFGVTSISELQGAYAQNVKKIAEYYDRIDAGRLPTERGWVLTDDDRLRREVIHRLMCNFFVDLEQVAASHGADPAPLLSDAERLDWAEAADLLQRDGATLEVTPRGQLFVRNLAMVFDAYLPTQQSKPTFSSTV